MLPKQKTKEKKNTGKKTPEYPSLGYPSPNIQPWDDHKAARRNASGRRGGGNGARFAGVMRANLPRINVRRQTTGPGFSENTTKRKCPQTRTNSYHVRTAARVGGKNFIYREAKIRIAFGFSGIMQERRERAKHLPCGEGGAAHSAPCKVTLQK